MRLELNGASIQASLCIAILNLLIVASTQLIQPSTVNFHVSPVVVSANVPPHVDYVKGNRVSEDTSRHHWRASLNHARLWCELGVNDEPYVVPDAPGTRNY